MPKGNCTELEMIMSMTDLSKYVGKWIALVDSEIVSIGESGKTVFSEAKAKHPSKEPFIMKVPKHEVMLM